MAINPTTLIPAVTKAKDVATLNDVDVVSKSITTLADNIYYPNTTMIDGGKITTGSITVGSITADKFSGNSTWENGSLQDTLFKKTPNFTTGFRLKSNAAGTAADPTIYGAYIKGGVIDGTTVSARNLVIVTDAGYTTKSIVGASSTLVSSQSITFDIYGDGYSLSTTQRIASTSSMLLFTGLNTVMFIYSETQTHTNPISYNGWPCIATSKGTISVDVTVNGVSATVETGGEVTINGIAFRVVHTGERVGYITYYASYLFIRPINSGINLGSTKLTVTIGAGFSMISSTHVVVYNI